jgi:hypothetical protein
MLEIISEMNSVIRPKLLRKLTFESSKNRKLKIQKIKIYGRIISYKFNRPTREDRDRQQRFQNKRIIDESKSFCTCLPSGNQVDGLPLAPRMFSSGRIYMCENQ